MENNAESFTSFCKNFKYKNSNLYDFFKDRDEKRNIDFDALENYKVTEKFRKDFEDMIVGKGAKISGDKNVDALLYYISLKVKSPSFPSFHGCSYVKEFRVGRICRNAIRIPICIGKSAKYFVGVVAHQDEGGETKYFRNCDVYAKNNGLNEKLEINEDINFEELETITYVYPRDKEDIKKLNDSGEEYQNINFEIEEGTTEIENWAFDYNLSVFDINIPGSVKEIDSSAFACCDNLSTVTLHEGLEKIGVSVFHDCPSLTSIDIPSSVKIISRGAFANCNNLASVTLHEGIMSIDDYAFQNCKSLTSIDIPSSVLEIMGYTFYGCDNLHEITYDNHTFDSADSFMEYFESKQNLHEDLDNSAENNVEEMETVTYVYPRDREEINELNVSGKEYQNINFEIEEGTTEIENWAFGGNLSIFEIDIPSSVKDIGGGAFYKCVNLSSVILHEGLGCINSLAFSGCNSLQFIVIPSSVKIIFYGAFSYCNNLSSVTLHEGLNEIDKGAFSRCTSLSSINIPSSVRIISQGAFYHCDNLHEIKYDNHTFDSVDSFMKYFKSKQNLHEDLDNSDNNIEELETITYVYPRDRVNIKKLSHSGEEYQNINFEIAEGTTKISSKAFEYNRSIFEIDIPSSVKEIGEHAFAGCTNLSSVTLPEGLKKIGASGFQSCKSLTSIDIPSSVKEIGESAFEWCTNLSSVKLHEGLGGIDEYCFYECKSLTSVDIPSSVKVISQGAFSDCDNLSSVTLHDGLGEIDKYCFFECKSLTSIDIPSSVKEIDEYAFAYCYNLSTVTLHDGLGEIDKYCFFECKSLTSIDIPSSVKVISRGAFYHCDSLSIVTLHEGLVDIDDYAFSECRSLTSINIPISVKYIRIGVFNGCTNLHEITYDNHTFDSVKSFREYFNSKQNLQEDLEDNNGNIEEMETVTYVYPIDWEEIKELNDSEEEYQNINFEIAEGTTEILDGAFENNLSIFEMDIPSSVKEIGAHAFTYCYNLSTVTLHDGLGEIDRYCFYKCKSLTSIDIPSSVKFISQGAFDYCTNLSSVTLHEGLESIDDFAFYECRSLKSIDIPSSVKKINGSAFAYCSNLSSVTLHEGLKDIGDCAFYECSSLTSVDIPSSVEEIGKHAFKGCSNLCEIKYDDRTFDSVSSFREYLESKQNLQEDLEDNNGNIEEMETVTYVYPRDNDEIESISASKEEYQNINFEIESGTTIIEEWAFGGNLSIFEIDIQSSVKKIGKCAFFGCPNLSSVTLHEGLEIINSHAFQNCKSLTSIDIPSSVKKINGSAFAYCSNLSSVTLHEGLKDIGDYAFYECSSLTSVDIPSSVLRIAECAFYNCDSLSTVTLHEGLKNIDDYVFYRCSSLASINIPSSVEEIGKHAFKGCSNLCEIKYDDRTFNSEESFLDYFCFENILHEDLDINSSYKIVNHDSLNKKLWGKNNVLKKEVKVAVVNIAKDFLKKLSRDDIPFDLDDIVIVGSNCSYNYTDNSDLDIHLIMDSSIYSDKEKKEMIKLLYDYAKKIWMDSHDVTIYNIPIELYVEINDKKTNKLCSNGIYSVLKDKWLVEPNKNKIPDIDLDKLKREVHEWYNKYCDILENPTIDDIDNFIDDIYLLRSDSLKAGGEYSIGNLTFKRLRDMGIIKTLKTMKNALASENLSLESLQENRIKNDNKNTYVYNGPISRFGRVCVRETTIFTNAVSLKQAINNIKFKAAREIGYDLSKGVNIEIDTDRVELLVDYDDDWDESKAITHKTCPKCGCGINDAGECPYCDLGDESALEK